MERHKKQHDSVSLPALPSRHLLESLARFGLILDPQKSAPRWTGAPARRPRTPEAPDQSLPKVASAPDTAPDAIILNQLIDSSARPTPRPCIFITGASGIGKSSLLRSVRQRLRSRAWSIHVVDPSRLRSGALARLTVADLFAAPAHNKCHTNDHHPARPCDGESPAARIDRMLAAMALAGLSDATLLARRTRDLSEGQRWRMAFALALAGAHHDGSTRAHAHAQATCSRGTRPSAPKPSRLIIADEFCSTLDRATAWAICVGLARARRRNPERIPALLFASAHDDLIPGLEPDLAIRLDSRAPGSPARREHTAQSGGRR